MRARRVRSLLGLLLFVGLLLLAVARAPSLERLLPTPTLRVSGPEELVFDWSSEACEPDDIPDVPARAFRDAAGGVSLIASHWTTRRMRGPDLDHLSHECAVLMFSGHDPDPGHFDDREWLHAVWTADGETVYALVHDEYQGHTHPGRCPSGEYQPCWYNAVTLVVSRDSGRTFGHAAPPSHFVAGIPYPYQPDSGPAGVFNPSNIVRSPRDGLLYAFVRAEAFREQPPGPA